MSFMFIQAENPFISDTDSLRNAAGIMLNNFKDNPEVFFRNMGNSAILFGLKVLAALLIYLIGALLIKWIRAILNRSFERKGTEKTVASFVTSLVGVSMTVLLIVITVGTLGVNTSSLAALIAAGGMAIGMALSGTLQNFAGGVMILAFKPFKVGDFITAQGVSGTVTDVTIVNTLIKTVDGRVAVIPNGILSNGTIDNYSANSIRRVEWIVNIEYGSNSDKCMEVIEGILRSDMRILDRTTPGAADPVVMLASMEDSCIVFKARAWTGTADYWNVFFDVNKNLYDRLPAAGFPFAYPHMDITVKPK